MRKSGNRISLAWLGFALTVVLGAAGIILFARNAGTPVPASWGVTAGDRSDAAQWINSLQQILIGLLIMTGLAGALLGVVSMTMRPDAVNLWIRTSDD